MGTAVCRMRAGVFHSYYHSFYTLPNGSQKIKCDGFHPKLLHDFSFSAILCSMEFLVTVLPWLQIILSIILVAAILLQQTGAGVGGAFGGGDDSIRYTRRGMEKVLFYTSIIVAILFALSAFAMLILRA